MTQVESKINKFINDIHKCLENELYHAALTITLTLPDICSKLENPGERVGVRYKTWFNEYVKEKYTRYIGPNSDKKVFFNENDAYALRCSFLHQGETNIEGKNSIQVLDDFHFISPPKSGSIHCNQINKKLQLQIDLFCKDITSSVEEWLQVAKDNDEINERASNMITINNPYII